MHRFAPAPAHLQQYCAHGCSHCPAPQATPDTLPLPPALRPFETGVWLWCTLVLNLVNLILADKHWARGAARGGLPPSEVWQQLPLRARMRLLARWAALVRTRFAHGSWRGGLVSLWLGLQAVVPLHRPSPGVPLGTEHMSPLLSRYPVCIPWHCSLNSNPQPPSSPPSPAVRPRPAAQPGRDWRHAGLRHSVGRGAVPSGGGSVCLPVGLHQAGRV